MNVFTTVNAAETRPTTASERERNRQGSAYAVGLSLSPVAAFAELLETNLTQEHAPRRQPGSNADQSRWEPPARGVERAETGAAGRTAAEAGGARHRDDAVEGSADDGPDRDPHRLTRAEARQETAPHDNGNNAADESAEPAVDESGEGADTADDGAVALTASVPNAAGQSGTASAANVATALGGAVQLGAGWRAAMTSLDSASSNPEARQEQASTSVRGQVLDAIARSEGLSNGRGSLRLQLDPAHLGRVEVMFRRQGDVLEVTMRAETPEAQRALREGADSLSQALLARGGGWTQVQITVTAETSNDTEEDAEQNLDEGTDNQDHPNRDPDRDTADQQQDGGKS